MAAAEGRNRRAGRHAVWGLTMSTHLDWSPVPDTPMEIGVGQQADGSWLAVGRWAASKETWGGACEDDRNEAIAGVLALIDFTIAAAKITAPATEPTPIGLQYVIPGCEKDQSRGPAQFNLF